MEGKEDAFEEVMKSGWSSVVIHGFRAFFPTRVFGVGFFSF